MKYQTRRDILEWYFIAWYYDWVKGIKCSCCFCCWRKDKKKDKNENDNDTTSRNWRIHHKSCYGCLVLQTDQQKETYKGISMSNYLEIYERKRRHKIEKKDKQLLKQLTTDAIIIRIFSGQ